MQRWLATAWPLARGCLLWLRPPAKGWPVAARASLQGAAPARDQTAGATARWWPIVARHLQGAAATCDQAVGTVASGLQTAARRKATYGLRHRPQGLSPAAAAPMEVSPVGATPAVGVAVGGQGQSPLVQGWRRRRKAGKSG
ncbi:hypothetical protein GW17_00027901 [Ensete ventricosum]|nr:hypothetical protein GW17_00027901 [Ensete ventricosum]RZR92781.1 hypothetical protein BHM03_00021124 [Ensete ventricosum]